MWRGGEEAEVCVVIDKLGMGMVVDVENEGKVGVVRRGG